MKRAYLVEFSIKTRVVVEIPQDKANNSPNKDDELFAIIADTAIDKIASNPRGYLVRENVDDLVEDWECPVGTFEGEDGYEEE